MDALNLLPEGGEAYFYPDFLDHHLQRQLLIQLEKEIEWDQRPIKIFGRDVMEPRLTAFYGDRNISYKYSGKEIVASFWTPTLVDLKNRVESKLNEKFNCVLVNLYRDGEDYMGWHRDNEKELGKNPIIASLSLGQERDFLLKKYAGPEVKVSLKLTSGSLLVMKGETQTNWSHSLPKRKKIKGKRMNLTFRNILKL